MGKRGKFWKGFSTAILGLISILSCIAITIFKASPTINVCDEIKPWGELFFSICSSMSAAVIASLFLKKA